MKSVVELSPLVRYDDDDDAMVEGGGKYRMIKCLALSSLVLATLFVMGVPAIGWSHAWPVFLKTNALTNALVEVMASDIGCQDQKFLIKVAGADLYLHAWGGAREKANIVLHGVRDYAMKWAGVNSGFTLIPYKGRLLIKVAGANLYLHAWGGTKEKTSIVLHGDKDYAMKWKEINSGFELESHQGRYLIKVVGANLYLHAWGGAKEKTNIVLHGDRDYAMKWAGVNSGFEIHDFVLATSTIRGV